MRLDFLLPEENRGTIQDDFARAMRYIPAWVTTASVSYIDNHEDGDFSADVVVKYKYRAFALRVTAKYLAQTQAERDRILKHEMGHVVMGPMADAHARVIDGVRELLGCVAADQWDREFADAEEQVVEDLAQLD